jgi:hypothetical protein
MVYLNMNLDMMSPLLVQKGIKLEKANVVSRYLKDRIYILLRAASAKQNQVCHVDR